MRWIVDADGDRVLVPAAWVVWRKGAFLYRQGPHGVEVQDASVLLSQWRAVAA